MGNKGKVGYILGARVWGDMYIGPGSSIIAPGGIIGAFNTTGQVFFVNGFTGSNLNPGTDPDLPLLTITYALSLCVAGRDDYIIVLDHWQEAMPIAINKTRTHIVGLSRNPSNPFVSLNAAADTAIFTISALSNDCEIAGFNFGGGAAHAAIENVGGTPMGVYIHDCQFGHQFAGNTPQDGIRIGVNATALRIEHCKFMGNEAAGGGTITRDGIRFAGGGNPLGGAIRNNVFVGIPAVCINIVTVAAGTGGFEIVDNEFYADIADAQAAGWAITLAGPNVVVGCLVARNIASQTGDGTGNNPYRDLSTGIIGTTLNGWGLNYSGPAALLPATV